METPRVFKFDGDAVPGDIVDRFGSIAVLNAPPIDATVKQPNYAVETGTIYVNEMQAIEAERFGWTRLPLKPEGGLVVITRDRVPEHLRHLN